MPEVPSFERFSAWFTRWLDERRRSDPGFSVTRLAETLGWSPGHVHNVASGRRAVRSEARAPLLAALGVPPEGHAALEALMEADAVQIAARRRERAAVGPARARQGARARAAVAQAGGAARRRRGGRRGRRARLDGPTLALLAVLRAGAACPAFREEVAWLRRRLRPPVESARISAALRALREGRERAAPEGAALGSALARAREGLHRDPIERLYLHNATWTIPVDRWGPIAEAAGGLFAEALARLRAPDDAPPSLVVELLLATVALSDLIVEDGIVASRLHIPPCREEPLELASWRGARMSREGELPSVWDAWDHRVFLKSWLEAKQAQNPRYTLTMFARRAGCEAGHVGNVRDGRRKLLDPYVDGFSMAMGLDGAEAQAWALLVRYTQASGELDRAHTYEQICLHRRRHLGDGAAALFLAHTRRYYVAVRELAFAPGFRPDPDWIAARLRPAITPDQARDALDLLCGAGLLRSDGRGGLAPGEPFVEMSEPHELMTELRSHTYNLYQLQVLAEGPRDPLDRYHHGVAAVSERRLQEVREFLAAGWAPVRALLREAQASLAPGAPARLFHAATSLFCALDAELPDPASP